MDTDHRKINTVGRSHEEGDEAMTTAQVGDIWYRLEDQLVSLGVDEYGDPLGSGVELRVIEYKVTKVTPKGVRLHWWFLGSLVDKEMGGKTYPGRFVLFEARKRFACPTMEDAVTSFVARKDRQMRVYLSRVRHAKSAARQALALVGKQREAGDWPG